MTAPSSPQAGGRVVESREPGSGTVWRTFPCAGADDVAAAVEAARGAQPAWAARPIAARAAMLRRFHDVLYRRRGEVVALISRETGKPRVESLFAEVAVVLDYARYYALQAPRALEAPWRRTAGIALWRKRVRIEHRPHGVIAIISPWNYPFMLAAGVALPALVAGNAIVLKPSELTPSVGELLVDLLREAGAPPNACAVLQGDGASGAALVAAKVDKVFFTGSVATGRRVAIACAERLVPCALELGGSDPAIVLADADIAHAASGIAWGRFSNAGQTCVAPKRVYVEAPAYERFVAALADVVSRLRAGDDMGPLIRPAQAALLAAQRDDALARGARVVATATGAVPGESWFAPTVLADVPPDSRALTEETFGPLLPVVRVGDAEEAVSLANASEFGLSASVWGRDRARAVAVGERLDAGTVVINDVLLSAGMAGVPHGGVKASGSGRSHGIAGLLECVRTRAIIDDRFAGWRQAWWFGYSDSAEKAVDAFVRLAHGLSIVERTSGIARVLRRLRRPERPL